MIVFQKFDEFPRTKIDEEDYSVSTLLIPQFLLEDLKFKLERNTSNLSIYLRSLLRRYRSITHSGLLPKPSKIKTEYQEKDQNLHKLNFRPRNSDWIELGELALAFGKSRCWVFVYLLKLDILNLWHILVRARLHKVVPTTSSRELKVFYKLQRVLHNFARGYNVRI